MIKKARLNLLKFLLLVLTLVNPGCFHLGPKYKRPEFPVPCCYQGATNQQQCDEIWERWWDIFNDPCLTELIETAICKNFDLKITIQKVKEAKGKFQSLRSILFPTGTFMFDSARVNASADIPVNLPFNNYDSYIFGFNAIWEPDVLGFNSGAVAGGKRGLESILEKHREATVILISELGRAYFTLRAIQCQEQIIHETLYSIQEMIDLSKLQLRHQLISNTEIVVLEKTYCASKQTLLSLEESKNLLLNTLSMMIGELPHYLDQKLSGCSCLPDLSYTLPPTGLPSELLCRRPDVREAERILMKTTYDVGTAMGLFFPRLNLLSNLAYVSFLIGDLFNSLNQNAFNNAAILWPIIQGGRLIGNYKTKRSEEAQAFYYYGKTVLGAFHDVENQLDAFNKEKERYHTQICVRENIEKVVTNMGLLEKNGLASRKNYLEQKLQLLQTEAETVQSKSQMAVRMIALYKALGGGWEAFKRCEGENTKNPPFFLF